jgi:hypothetical protein
MQKIMFNDRCALTYAVIDEIKNNTRRIEGGKQFQLAATAAEDFTYEEATGCIVMCCQGIEIFRHKCRYKVGEIVAVAQSYEQVYRQGNMDADDAIIRGLKYDPGMCNKMYIRAALMPHQIRITGIRCEQLQDISDEDCMREGVRQFTPDFPKDFPIHPTHFVVGNILKNTPREAFAALIDRTCGRGTWERNPWVVAYEFELVK